MSLLAQRGRALSEAQMPERATLLRTAPDTVRDASGGVANSTGWTPDPTWGSANLPCRIGMAKPTLQGEAGGELQSKAPDATIRVPSGVGLLAGDRLQLTDGRLFEVTGQVVRGSFDADEHVFADQIN
jgi:hypothetical protein